MDATHRSSSTPNHAQRVVCIGAFPIPKSTSKKSEAVMRRRSSRMFISACFVLLSFCLSLSSCGYETTGTSDEEQTPRVYRINPKSLSMFVGQTALIRIESSLGTAPQPTYFVEPSGVISISGSGEVLALQTGVAEVTISFPDSPPSQIRAVVYALPKDEEGCKSPDPRNLSTFPPCTKGGGIFGEWFVDEHGLPAYSYTLDHLSDPRAVWPHSESGAPTFKERRDHFVVLGNRRINFLAVNDGYVSVYTHERAPTFLNRFSEAQQNLGGGFSYIHEAGSAFCTAYKYAQDRSRTRRVFGSSYFVSESTQNGLRIRHTLYAPEGDDPVLLDDVEIENLTNTERHPKHFEYFDANRHQLLIQWVRTGVAATLGDLVRDKSNDAFLQTTEYDPEQKTLFASMSPKASVKRPKPDVPSSEDFYPPVLFLSALSGPVNATYGDQQTFFGKGTPALPDAVRTLPPSTQLAPRSAMFQPAALVLRSDLHLPPFGKQRLRFAYGYVSSTTQDSPKNALSFLEKYRKGEDLSASLSRLRSQLVYAYSAKFPLLHRETAWRSAQLLGHTVYSDYYKVSYTPQGSAYLYLHGADGVPRDQALFALPLVYADPGLAKGNLRLILSLQEAETGKLPYSMTNFGQHDGALIHNNPSDLDLFLFLALGEYLAATGDHSFLKEELPYYPKGVSPPASANGYTVLDHIRVAFRHLVQKVGLGPHGLVRIHDGDWSDGIVYEDLSPLAVAFTQASGESIPNSQMALYVLPLLAKQIESVDRQLALDMETYAEKLKDPVRRTFGGRWFGRAFLRNSLNQSYLKGNDQEKDPFSANFIDLEAQPWGLLTVPLSASERNTLLDQMDARLFGPSPIGPVLREKGMVWPAISHLQTWVYAKMRKEKAWQSMQRHLYATHAAQWEAVWPGIWSAPDGLNSGDGQTWKSPVTPMTDFPVANMNSDAMFLFGLLRTAGVSPSLDGKGLDIVPADAPGFEDFVVDTRLLRVESSMHRLAVEYRAQNEGSVTLKIQDKGTEKGFKRGTLHINAQRANVQWKDGFWVVPLRLKSGERTQVELLH